MPNMGISQVRFNDKIWLRKYRWNIRIIVEGGERIEIGGTPQGQDKSLVQIAGRPKLTFQDQTVNHRHETITYPSRLIWEPIEITVFNVARDSSFTKWIEKCYTPTSWGFFQNIIGTALVFMFDGYGRPIEQWTLEECWPLNFDFGDLDRTSAEIAEISFSMRYSRATFQNI